MINLPKSATVVEVGPRDGLQSLDKWVETDNKVAMIDRLSEAGFPVIEVTSFAHPRVVPMLRDAEEEVFLGIAEKIQEFGWSIVVYFEAADLEELEPFSETTARYHRG